MYENAMQTIAPRFVSGFEALPEAFFALWYTTKLCMATLKFNYILSESHHPIILFFVCAQVQTEGAKEE